MVYTRNYYHVLGLEAPSLARNTHSSIHRPASADDIRRAYRNALLRAHPDKAPGQIDGKGTNGGKKTKQLYTVDDVKEAFSVLGDAALKAEYDSWIVSRPDLTTADAPPGGAEFVLGLEMLDLEDFKVVASGPSGSSSGLVGNGREALEENEQEQHTEWIRGCRCGAEDGFRITEDELEEALGRGEMEVLVGCQGCSLWVRVGFAVEEE